MERAAANVPRFKSALDRFLQEIVLDIEQWPGLRELAWNRQVHTVLARLDCAFLAKTRCFFGGGTRIVLELGEYRESRGMDFLCSDRDGYRLLRESVSESSLGPIMAPRSYVLLLPLP